MKTVVLVGIEAELSHELTAQLSAQYPRMKFIAVSSVAECLSSMPLHQIDLVFCSSEANHFLAVLDGIKPARPALPVVVVSRHPEVSQWLDAIEAGASDYCAAPFEPVQMQWLMGAYLGA